jgi:hypothetical protein
VDILGTSERLPNHALEVHWLQRKWSGRSYDDLDELLARTCLGSPLDLLGCSTADLYALTHVILYGSDFGSREIAWPRPAQEVLEDIDCAVALALDAENFDLTAELLWSYPMLDLPWTASAGLGLQVLLTEQNSHGFLPGPDFAANDYATLDTRLTAEYVARTSYHSTLALGILSTVLMHKQYSICGFEWLEETDPIPSERSAIVRTERAWERVSRKLVDQQQEKFRAFRHIVALRRACSACDLVLIKRTFESAIDSIELEMNVSKQALALLRRAALISQAKT